jgi:hypothetical protein
VAAVFAYRSPSRSSMPSETSASSQSVLPRGCNPSLARSTAPVSGPSARVVNSPSSTALTSALEPAKARVSCMIASGVGCSLLMAGSMDAAGAAGPRVRR